MRRNPLHETLIQPDEIAISRPTYDEIANQLRRIAKGWNHRELYYFVEDFRALYLGLTPRGGDWRPYPLEKEDFPGWETNDFELAYNLIKDLYNHKSKEFYDREDYPTVRCNNCRASWPYDTYAECPWCQTKLPL